MKGRKEGRRERIRKRRMEYEGVLKEKIPMNEGGKEEKRENRKKMEGRQCWIGGRKECRIKREEGGRG